MLFRSDEDPQSILTHQNYIPQWNLSENYGTVIFQTGDFSAVVRLFDMNGKLLTERFVNRSESWSLPLFNGILLMQVNENNHFSTRKIISPL